MTNASVCEELPSKSVAVSECDAGSREACCDLEYIRGSSGASRETYDFLCISKGFAHARFAWLPGPSRLQKDAESKEVPEQMAPVNLLRSGFCQKCMNFHCF